MRKDDKKRKENALLRLFLAFKNGSYATRLSFAFMGFGQFARGQFLKGALYALTQLGFILFLIFCLINIFLSKVSVRFPELISGCLPRGDIQHKNTRYRL